ncbi:phospholipase A2-like isoform X2 [Ceratina calcarata]|nr:phospholipase A2-like isoform X2 [Ceratina calcarata]
MMYAIRIMLLCVVIFSIYEFGKCGTNSKLKETYVSSMEKVIRRLIKSKQKISRGVLTIKDDLKQIALSLLKEDDGTSRDAKQEKNSTTIADILSPLKIEIQAIYPGTYWCGDGNISPNESDLGLFEKTDACCKAHDLCSENIPADGIRDGLKNNGIFTRSACVCDEAFYGCLKEANNIIATKIGTTYFNLLRPQCFKKYYPIINCKIFSRRRIVNDKCEEYNFDTSQPQVMEWFDNPDFFTII